MEKKKLDTESLEDILEKYFENHYPIFTGIEQFDNITKGLFLGELVVVAGRPNTGKTEFALQLMDMVIKNSLFNLVYYSLELSQSFFQFIRRFYLTAKLSLFFQQTQFLYVIRKLSHQS